MFSINHCCNYNLEKTIGNKQKHSANFVAASKLSPQIAVAKQNNIIKLLAALELLFWAKD
jgi:hypothetical protein